MRPYRAVIVDDECSANQILHYLLRDMADIEIAQSFTSPVSALEHLSDQRYDLLFLDINMPELNGLELLKKIPDPPITVLITAHANYALDAFELGVRDYLLKPVSPERLHCCIERIRPLMATNSVENLPPRLAVKQGNGHRLVDPRLVSHMRAEGNFSVLYLEDNPLFVSESLKNVTLQMEPFGFLRIHKSHTINMSYVGSVTTSFVHLVDGTQIPLGRAYKRRLMEKMADYS